MILGHPISFSDLEYFNLELYKNLKWLLDNDGVEILGLDFSVAERVGYDVQVVDLISNGRRVDVTDENKHLFN